MEKSKPAQNHEQGQPTPEYDVVKTFPADLDVTIRPLTVIRSGKDGGGIRHDGGWTPGDMLCVCKEGTGSIELFVKVHKPIKVYGEHVYEECVPVTKIVSLKKLQSREANKGFNESYIQELYGKSTEEMIEEGERAVKQISNSSVVEEDSPDFERPKVSPKIGSTAVKAAGIKKPIDTNKVKTSEPVREPVETDKTGVGSPALKIPEPTMELIRATEVNGSVGLPAVEPVKKPVETNEVNIGMLPEDFKDVIDNFEKHTRDNNNQFFAKVQYITGELDRFRGLIKYNQTAAMNDSVISEMITSEPDRIRDLEDSRAKDANEFKNKINDILEDLEKKIKNDDERRRLVKLTEHVDKMGVDDRVLDDATNGLLDKLIRIRSNIEQWQNDRWGEETYKKQITQMINEIVDSDLPSVNRRRQSILEAVEAIETAGS